MSNLLVRVLGVPINNKMQTLCAALAYAVEVLTTAEDYNWGVNSFMYTLDVFRTSPGSSLNFIQEVAWVFPSDFFFSPSNCLQLFTPQPSHRQVLSLSFFSLSLPPSFLLRALQNNFFRLMFLVYFTSETGALVGVKWAKSQSISHIPNWLSLTYMISPPPQKPFSEMISQTGSLHLNWSLWWTRKKNREK